MAQHGLNADKSPISAKTQVSSRGRQTEFLGQTAFIKSDKLTNSSFLYV